MRRGRRGWWFRWGSNPNGFVGKDRGEGDYKELEVGERFWDENRFEVAVRFIGGVH